MEDGYIIHPSPQTKHFEMSAIVRINCNIFDPDRYGCECMKCEMDRDTHRVLGCDNLPTTDKLEIYGSVAIYVRPILPWSKYHEVMACTGKTYHLSSDEIDLVSNPESGK